MLPKLVSIITPCYNTGKYLPNLFDSVLGQTYPYIEMITIDDGSTDDTAEIIKSYIPKFEAKGYLLLYVKQENSGQSVAVQRGLDMVKGEYLVWPDSDDYYASDDAIKKMVERMVSMGNEVAMVRTQELLVEDTSEHRPIALFGGAAAEMEARNLFEDCLFAHNGFFFPPGAYMIRFDALKKSTKFPIYTSKNAGQNWQLLLPILYHYRCSTILEPLYCVVQRESSHSRGLFKGYEQTIAKYTAYYETIIATLSNIVNIDKVKLEYYQKEIHKKYLTILLKESLEHFNKQNSVKYYRDFIKNAIPVPIKYTVSLVLLKMGLLPIALKLKRVCHN